MIGNVDKAVLVLVANITGMVPAMCAVSLAGLRDSEIVERDQCALEISSRPVGEIMQSDIGAHVGQISHRQLNWIIEALELR